ncbi:hypothetical protein MEQU1_002951 [Malassezia equina]|uniref:Uncharacterized protein n=1 Tax=Malassezia equina TaxID=1381935 RepID=A0AAF0EFU4_9BASI|nr:hypothetical protein MEQU1_002951 [Malassezia equina]
MNGERKANLIKLAAQGLIDSHYVDATLPHAPLQHAQATPHTPLTADNLEQIPIAEQLAPGIRMPDQVLESNPNGLHDTSTDILPSSESGMDTPGAACVPPELDPRTSIFRPGAPSTGSVFSVAVQPGTPKSIVLDPMERHTDVTVSSPAPSRSYPAESPCSEDPPSSRATTPQTSTGMQSFSLAANPSSGTDSASVIYSDAGSVMSDRSHGTSDLDVRHQERAIEAQRMQDRARLGGEVGIGGPISVPFARLRDRLHDMDAPQRSASTSATAATSPVQSPGEKLLDTPMLHSPYFPIMNTPGAPPDSEDLSHALASTLT